MADTAEIANLLVRLTGDAAGFQRMLADAIAQTKSFGATVTQTLASIAEFAGFRGSLNAFTEFQDDLVRIETTVKANGLAVQETMKDYRAFAQQIEDTTRVSAVSATNLLAMAHSFDLVGEKAQKAVRLAVGISQGRPGVSPMEVIRALSMFWRTSEITAGHGSSGGGGASNMGIFYLARILGLYGRGMGGRGQGGGGAETSKKMIEEINKQLKIAEDISGKLGQNFGGQLARIKSYLQDIGVELGGIVAEWMKPFVDQMQKAVKWFKEMDPGVKRIVTGMLALATVLTAGGPIMRFFLLLSRLAVSISPLTIGLTGAIAATALWARAVGGLGAAWTIARERFLQLVNLGIGWIGRFASEHKQLVTVVASTALALGSVVVVYRVLTATLATVNALIDALRIRQILSRVATIAWTVALLAANIAMRAFGVAAFFWRVASVAITATLVVLKGVLVVLVGLLGFSSVGWSLYTIGATIAKGVTWLFNAALVVMHTLLSLGVTLLVAAALAAASFGAALSLGVSAVTALYTAVAALTSPLVLVWSYLERMDYSLANVMDAVPALRVVADRFKEWWVILKNIVRAMTVDMNLAWELTMAGATLAALQIRALWPPLWTYISSLAKEVWPPVWEFIKAGFFALQAFIVKTFVQAFVKAAGNSADVIGGLFAALSEALSHPINAAKIFNGFKMGLRLALGGDARAELENEIKKAVKDLQDRLSKVKVTFGKVVDTPEIVEARKRIEELTKQLGQSIDEQKKGMAGLDLGAPYRAAQKDIQKWEAALYGSAEAYSRIQEYFDKLNESGEKAGVGKAGEGGGGLRPEPGPVVPPPGRNDEGGGGKGGETGIQNLHKLIKGYMDKGWPVLVTGIKDGIKIGKG